MRRPNGVLMETNLVTGSVREIDTCMCGHCNRHIPMWEHQSGTGHWCSHCGKTLCPRCASLGDCDPLEEKINRALYGQRFYRDVRG